MRDSFVEKTAKSRKPIHPLIFTASVLAGGLFCFKLEWISRFLVAPCRIGHDVQ
jgi:hypothetical protein